MTNLIVNELKIENFKSIKSLTLKPKRVNLFIGKPNTGKSNILEALNLFCLPALAEIGSFVRYEKPSHLFYDQNIKQRVSVSAGNFSTQITMQNGQYHFVFSEHLQVQVLDIGSQHRHLNVDAIFNEQGKLLGDPETLERLKQFNVKFKKYEFRKDWKGEVQKHLAHLQVPFGENIFYMLETHPELFERVAGFFTQYGLDLVLNQESDTMLMQKKIGNRVFQLPYSLVADTLQRMIFYLAAIKTNKESVLIFEEPETHSFPLYIQRLALEITNSIENQFFIATHSPYLFNTILEKAPKEHVAVFITYFENHETKVMLLSEEDKSEVMNYGMDVFFHLDEFITEKQLQ
jgi:AAA15 family ATPase/GTPase